MADNGRYNAGRRKMELVFMREQATKHLPKGTAFGLPTNHQQKHLSHVPECAKV
jgi:hypothetical protein